MVKRRPEIPKIYGSEVRTRRPAVLVPQGIRDLVEIVVYDTDGEPRNLTSFTSATVRFSEAILSSQVITETAAEITNPEKGEIRFHVPEEINSEAGLYQASVGFFIDGRLEDIYKIWVYVEPSVWSENVNQTLPQIDELRTYLRDTSPIENELLDSYQYFLTDICEAIYRTVQFWNSVPPFKNTRTTKSFNYPYLMRLGIEVFLMESLLEWARKNRFPYQAAGIAEDDLARYDRYEQLLQIKKQELAEKTTVAKAIEELQGSVLRLG